jgi:hypothetical protein
MQQNETLLLAVVVILVLVLAYQNRSILEGEKEGFGGPILPGTDIYAAGPEVTSPFVPIRYQNDLYRRIKMDGNDPNQAEFAADLAKNYQYWATTPRDLEDQQRTAWFEAISAATGQGAASYDPAQNYDASSSTAAYHAPGASMNYQDALTDLVANPRMRAAHQNWWSEVAPFSQTSMKVDTIDEAATMSAVPRQGLYSFRLSAPTQHNPMMLTDQDPMSYARQATGFCFGV